MFLQRQMGSTKGSSRHLTAINIQSIAHSIRTHGTGIMNTTINFTYQYLAQKFYIFSQFLCDEYIRSWLAKDRKWYKKNKREMDNKVSFSLFLRAPIWAYDFQRLNKKRLINVA